MKNNKSKFRASVDNRSKFNTSRSNESNIRKLLSGKANIPTLKKGIPTAAEGQDGEFTLRDTRNGLALYVKANGKWYQVKLSSATSTPNVPDVELDQTIERGMPVIKARYKNTGLYNQEVAFQTPKILVKDKSNASTLLVQKDGILTARNESDSADADLRCSSIKDSNGKKVIDIASASSAVNFIKNTNSATTAAPSITPDGDDDNIGITLKPKGEGDVFLQSAGSNSYIQFLKSTGSIGAQFDVHSTTKELKLLGSANDIGHLDTDVNGAMRLWNISDGSTAHLKISAKDTLYLNAGDGTIYFNTAGESTAGSFAEGTPRALLSFGTADKAILTSVTNDDMQISSLGTGNVELNPNTGVTKFLNASDTDDLCTMTVAANGETTIATADSDGAAGHLKLDADGDITLDAASGNIYVKDNGGNYTPGSDYEIATKKYVDDNAGGGGAIDISGTPSSNNYARWTDADTLEARTTAEVLSDIGAQASGNYITGTGSLSAQDLTDIGNLSGTNTGDQATGISDGNILECNANVADNDFLKIDGTKVEGRTASELLSDIGVYDIKYVGYYSTSAAASYLPMNGYIIEGTSQTGRNEYQAFVAPYNGTLEKIMWRSEIAQNGTFRNLIWESTDGTEVPGTIHGRWDPAVNVADDTTVEFDYNATPTSGTNVLTKGRIYAISIDPASAPNDTNATVVFKWDITT